MADDYNAKLSTRKNSSFLVTLMFSLGALCSCGGPDNSPPTGNIPGTPVGSKSTVDATTGAGDVASLPGVAPEAPATPAGDAGGALPNAPSAVNPTIVVPASSQATAISPAIARLPSATAPGAPDTNPSNIASNGAQIAVTPPSARPVINARATAPLSFAGSGATVNFPFLGSKKEELEGPLEPPLDEDSADAWYSKGFKYQQKDKPHLAAACYEKACKLNPKQKSFWADLGAQYQGLKKPQSARNAYMKAWELDMLDIYNICSIGYNDSMQAKDDESYRFYCMALSVEPSHQDAWFQLISVLHRLNKEQFLPECQRLSEAGRDPQNIHVALALVDDYLKEHPDDYDFIVDRAFLLTRLMRVSEAHRGFDQALKIQPEGVRALIGLGFLYDAEANREKAKATFNRVLELSPTQSVVWAAMGAISANEGNYKQALNEYESALKISPSNAFWSEQVGIIYSRKKAAETAKANGTVKL
jgi:tetratricopeptide (TPR) repeat protein